MNETAATRSARPLQALNDASEPLKERRWPVRTLRADIVFAMALIALCAVAYQIRDVLLLVYVSAIFAVVLSPAIKLIRKIRIAGWRPGEGVALLVLLLVIVAALAAFFAYALPPLFRELRELNTHGPEKLALVEQRVRTLPFFDAFTISSLQPYINKIAEHGLDIFSNIAIVVFDLFTCIILTSYFILDGHRSAQWFLSLFTDAHRGRMARTLTRSERRIRHWLVGQSIVMATLAALSAVAYGFMHLKYFGLIAVMSGLMNIVPIIGPIVSVCVACLVAAIDSWYKVLGVIVFYGIYQQFETAFLTPKIMKSTLDLPPITVIIALLVGGRLAGVLGALISVPTAALISVLVDEYMVKQRDKEHEQSAVARG